MAYVTRSDLVDRFGEDEIAQRESMLPSEAVGKAIADASATADDYLAGRYVVPVAPVPDTLKRLVCDIARYYLYDDKSTDEVLKRYEQAKQELLHISQGKATLACPWGGVAGEPLGDDPQAGGGEVGYSFPQRQMTDDTLRGFA